MGDDHHLVRVDEALVGDPTGRWGLVERFDTVSCGPSSVASQTVCPSDASPSGVTGVDTSATTSFDSGRSPARGRRRCTTPTASRFETHTEPAPTATSSGTRPTGIVATTSPATGSMRDTDTDTDPSERKSEFTTHSEPLPAAIPIGPPPTDTVETTSATGSPAGEPDEEGAGVGTDEPVPLAQAVSSIASSEGTTTHAPSPLLTIASSDHRPGDTNADDRGDSPVRR